VKREAKLLLNKAVDSLTLAVEIFNRPHDIGRATATLILLDHAFEMLLKAAILHRGGRIREKRAKQTIGFGACVRIALSNGEVKFLSRNQALLLQAINGLRDAAQHHLLDISEGQLYMQAQAGLTLFRDIMKGVFEKDLALGLPERVLPLATRVPTDLHALFDSETKEISRLLEPGRRRRAEAMARLRPLAILDSALRGDTGQPGSSDLRRLAEDIRNHKSWADIFPAVAAVQLTSSGAGPTIQLRLTKKAGVPVQLVPEGTPGASVVAVKRVNELDYYNLGLKQLAEHVGLTMPRTLAVVKELNIQGNAEYFKEIRIGTQKYKRYSQKALHRIKQYLPKLDMDEVWRRHKPRGRRSTS